MEFKAGDRVHVKKLDWEDVDFFATLEQANNTHLFYKLKNCSNSGFENRRVFNEHFGSYGKNEDYYTLASDENEGLRWSDGSSAEGTPIMCDEEDTEEPVIQRINDMYNSVPTHYKADIDVIEFCRQHFTDEEFKGAMKFNLIKYPTRLGRKDDMVKELDKIIDYAQRYKEVLESGE